MADKTLMTACSKAASGILGDFPLFSSLPVEIQCRIFKEAFPDPEIVYWDFDLGVKLRGEADAFIFFSKNKHHALLPFLLACKNSHAEVFRNYEKIEINFPTLMDFQSCNLSDRYRYLRKAVDTLSVSFLSFISLDMEGGSMTLNYITHLALDVDFDYAWDGLYMRVLAKFYISISIHCPALNTLYFIYDYGVGRGDWCTHEYHQIFDVSEGCLDLDWDFPRLKQSLNEQFRYSSNRRQNTDLHTVLEDLKDMDREFKQLSKNFDHFMNTTENDTWDKPEEETLKYWENISPTPVLLLRCQDHFLTSPCPCKSEYPELYLRQNGIYLRVYKDRTPLHMYTGLRQIFDGELW
ncbi:hypothetical protein BOTNAR_0248g00110 [Botryotinia narcissicola]|uniref:2EXR domain-containing protein n=1 Tax=Botryotinia narcissicola TaxID=278944 RepID=A0A4Z1I1Y5_9HELO|nr:hypothetical protein BOTNAR_0248g00110 [Botryotinia narcissicola]